MYLHGSGAQGGFNPSTSDIDVLGVASRATTRAEKRAIAEGLLREPCPAQGIEFSLVTFATAQRPTRTPPFELHVANYRQAEVVDGSEHAGDQDLLLCFEICRRHGRALGGRDPAAVFAPIPRDWLLEMCDRELDWIQKHPYRELLDSGVLQACRAWRYLEEDALCSKIAGGEWALRHTRGKQKEIVASALANKKHEPCEPLSRSDVLRFIASVRTMFQTAIAR